MTKGSIAASGLAIIHSSRWFFWKARRFLYRGSSLTSFSISLGLTGIGSSPTSF